MDQVIAADRQGPPSHPTNAIENAKPNHKKVFAGLSDMKYVEIKILRPPEKGILVTLLDSCLQHHKIGNRIEEAEIKILYVVQNVPLLFKSLRSKVYFKRQTINFSQLAAKVFLGDRILRLN
jgi:hypothetical protein